MFEIPDDDDLFSEENLGDILAEADNSTSQSKQDAAVISDVLCPSGHGKIAVPLPSASDSSEHSMGGPQTKKMRVLTDVNCPPRTSAGIQKCTVDEQAASMRTPDVSRHIPTNHIVQAEIAEPDVTPLPRKRSLRKFPGPAGILPPAKPSEMSSIMGRNPGTSPECLSEDTTNKPGDAVYSSQTGGEVFGSVSWQSLVADLEPGADSVLTKFSIRAMLHKASRRLLPKGKVPLMLGVLDSMDFQGTDASVVLRDPTGQMQGTLHREVLKDFSLDLQTGAAVILRQVSVISPSPRTHYLNITAGNIVAIYPATGSRILTVPSSSTPEQAATVHPSKESVKHFVHAAEMELLEAVNAAKEAALTRLHPNRMPAQHSSPATPWIGTPARGSNPNSRLFSNTPFQGPRGGVSSPFTPHRPRQAPSPLAPAGGRFTFTKTTATPQMRTPHPGESPVTRINSVNTSQIQNRGVQNSGFPQRQALPNTPRPSGSVVTGYSTPSFSGGGLCDSRPNQGGGCRLQPPTPGTANRGSDSVHTPLQTENTSLSHAGSHTNTPQFTVPSALCESDRVRLTNTPVSSTHPPSVQTSASSQQSSQQSKWSFKRKSCGIPSQTVASGNDANYKSNSEGKTVMHKQQTSNLSSTISEKQANAGSTSGQTGVSVRLGVCGSGASGAASASVRIDSVGQRTPSAAVASGSLWDDDLDDDILTQLSDDF